MTDTIQWARLDDPSPAVSTLTWPSGISYMYLERVPDAWLTEAERQNGLRLEKFDSATPFDEWERGRIFCDAFELRWEKSDGVFQVVYVGPAVTLPGFAPADELDLSATRPQTRSYFLWGQHVSDNQLETIGAHKQENLEVFIEPKVPRLLHYPVSPEAKRVKLRVCEYIALNSGERCYYRFQGLEEA